MSGLKMGVGQAGVGRNVNFPQQAHRPSGRNVGDNWKEDASEVSQKSRTKFNESQVMIEALKMIRIPSQVATLETLFQQNKGLKLKKMIPTIAKVCLSFSFVIQLFS